MGIYGAALLTAVALVIVMGILVRRLSPGDDHAAMITAALVALPLQPLAFYLVRVPLDRLLHPLLSDGAYLVATTLYAPLTEEPAKWLVLLVPLVRRRLRPETAVALALATGLGFGLGEIWLVAHSIASIPAYADLPFWMFGGFITERLIVTFLHSAFVSFAFYCLATGRPFAIGALIGMALHYCVNLPIFLAGHAALGLPPSIWQTVVALTPVVMALALAAALNRMSKGRLRIESMGYSTCPQCHATYARPLLALNLGPWRYERCGACRHFHLVRVLRTTVTKGDKNDQA